MLFNVPQYIDIEDKVAGPLTARQLLWMLGMGGVLLVWWNLFDQATFFVAAVPTVILFVALAFWRPYNQPLIVFLKNAVWFLFRPKIYVWSRPTAPLPRREPKSSPAAPVSLSKQLSSEDVRRLAETVDRNRTMR